MLLRTCYFANVEIVLIYLRFTSIRSSAPFYALRLLQLQTISVAAVILHCHRRHGKEKDRTRLFYSSFSSIIEFRASVVSITRAFSNFPAAVLPYLWIRVGSRALFLFRLPLSCRIVNTSRLARFSSMIPRFCHLSRKAFPYPSFFLFAQQLDWLSRELIDLLGPSIALRVTLD